MNYEIINDYLIIRFAVVLSIGSEMNQVILTWKNEIHQIIKMNEKINNFILDFSELEYEFGDEISSLWMSILKMKKDVTLIAKGNTKKSLENLISISIPIKIYNRMSPISILKKNIELVISNFKDNSRKVHLEALSEGTIKQNIGLTQFPYKFHGPYVVEKKIIFNEDFLEFLWVIIYFVIYKIKNSRNSDYYNLVTGESNNNNLENINLTKLFIWGTELSNYHHSDWDTSLPNPETYNHLSENEIEIIKNTNVIFPVAFSYLFHHEFAHLYFNHPPYKLCTNDENKFNEKEADTYARREIFDNDDDIENKKTASFAIICSNLSLLFLKDSDKYIVSAYHPDIDCRIFEAFSDMYIEEENIKNLLAEAFCSSCLTFFSINGIPCDVKLYYEDRNEGIELILKIFDSIKK